MKKRSRIALLTALLTIVFAAGIGVYSNYIGMQIYQEIICSKAMRKSPRPSRCSCSETGPC